MHEIVEQSKPTSVRTREIAKRFLRHEDAVLIVVLAALIGALAIITKGLTAGRANVSNILLQSSIRGVSAVGQAMVVLSGGIDLSVGGVGLLCAIIGSSLMSEGMGHIVAQPYSMYQAIPVMLLVGAAIGAVNGAAVSRIGMPSLIVTLAMWEISKGIAFQVSQGQSIAQLPANFAFFGSGYVAKVPVPAIIFIAVAVLCYFVLTYTAFGRSIYAVGGNPVSAWLSGINVKNVRFVVFAVCGLLSGLAGVIVSARFMSASMQTLQELVLDCVAAVFVGGVSLAGGKGSLIGVVLGVLIIGVVNNGMSVLGAGPATQGIVKGAIIFTAVAIDYLRRR